MDQGQLDLEGRAAAVGLRHAHRSAMRGDYGADDGKPEPGPAAVAAAARVGADRRARRSAPTPRSRPGPWSTTDIRAKPFSVDTRDLDRSSADGVCTSALRTRLPTTWRSRMSSPVTITAPGAVERDLALRGDRARVRRRRRARWSAGRPASSPAAGPGPGARSAACRPPARHADRFLLDPAARQPRRRSGDSAGPRRSISE